MKILGWILGGVLVVAGAAFLLRESKWHRGFVDATARKPSGWVGRWLYSDPKPHYKAFHFLLDKLQLTPTDGFLDICCGGGTLLHLALQTVRHAAGLDHSADMIALTQANNARAVTEGRLDVRQGDAQALPWDDNSFDAVSNANALFFIAEPVQFLRETYRVLKQGGRFAVVTMAKHKLANMLWVPYRSSITLYTDEELARMLREAGFAAVEAYSPDGYLQIGYGEKT